MDRPVSPLLEFDATREAAIEPTRLRKARDVPEACVLTWFSDAAHRLVEARGGRLITRNVWEDGPHPLYEIEHAGRRLAVQAMPVGAPASAGLLEELIAFGCRAFVACGGAGVLRRDLTLGHLIVVSSALRDEGVSHHYLPPARIVEADAEAVRVLTDTLGQHGVPYATGRAWTTDAFYRETPAKIADRQGEDCIAVDMEASAIAAVARFRDVRLAQVFYGGDDLSGETWDHRAWTTQHEVRDNLLLIAADAAVRLADQGPAAS